MMKQQQVHFGSRREIKGTDEGGDKRRPSIGRLRDAMNIENKKQLQRILLAVGPWPWVGRHYLTYLYVQNNIVQQTKILAKEYTEQTTALQKS